MRKCIHVHRFWCIIEFFSLYLIEVNVKSTTSCGISRFKPWKYWCWKLWKSGFQLPLNTEDLLLNVLESTRWCESRHVRPPGITQITRQRPHTMKNIALFLNHQTNHQKNKLPSLGFECSFLYLDSGARNVKVVWFVDQSFIHFPN